MLDALTTSDTFENRGLLLMPIRRKQNRNRLAYHFLGRITEESFRALIPSDDYDP